MMTPKQREFIVTYFELKNARNLLEYPAFVSWFDEQLNLEAEDCAKLAESQAKDLKTEIPDDHGGLWAKKFGSNVALGIAALIRQRKYART